MIIRSNAKINAGLKVINRRPDGYHNLMSLFLPVVDFYDEIELIPYGKKGEIEMSFSGVEIPPSASFNSCEIAYKELQKACDLPGVKVHLHKNIPAGSGFGGASSNAVFMLLGLIKLFDLTVNSNELFRIALSIGSDCPFFLINKPTVVEGRGERLSEISLDLSSYRIKTYTSAIFVSTAEAFNQLSIQDNRHNKNFDISALQNIVSWKETFINDFEKPLFVKYPQLAIQKKRIYDEGAVYASLTGTGSGMFGLFKDETSQIAVD